MYNTISKVSSRNEAISISIFHFSNLYTNIPHHKLISMIGELDNFCFNRGDKELI